MAGARGEPELESLCSEVWLVDCDEAQQLQRLKARNCLSEGDTRRRIAAQWPLERKRKSTDFLIDNRGRPQELETQVKLTLTRKSQRIRPWEGGQ